MIEQGERVESWAVAAMEDVGPPMMEDVGPPMIEQGERVESWAVAAMEDESNCTVALLQEVV